MRSPMRPFLPYAFALLVLACSPAPPAATSSAPAATPVAPAATLDGAAPRDEDGEQPSTRAVPAEASTPDARAPSREPSPAATTPPRRCSDAFPPNELLTDNIASTPMSGLAEIVSSSKTGNDGKTPAPTTGYVTLRYDVRVLRWFAGAGADRLVLHQHAEADVTPRAPGELFFFSACASSRSREGYEPDVGYFFPLSPACRAEAETRGAAAAKRAHAKAGLSKATSACQP